MKSDCIGCKIMGALVLVGAINWGLIGILKVNLVAMALGDMTIASRVVYSLVGVAGLMKLIGVFKQCPACCKK